MISNLYLTDAYLYPTIQFIKIDCCYKMRLNSLILFVLLTTTLSSGKSRKRHLQANPDYLSTYNSFELSYVDMNIARMVISSIW